MPKITADVADGTTEFECESGRKLVLCLEDNGVDIMHRCGGNARCTTCRVEVISGDLDPMGEAEEAILATKGDLAPGTRLSCQVHVNSDVHVKVLSQSSVTGVPAGTRPEE